VALPVGAPRFDLFAPGSAEALVLFGTRVSGLVLVAPVFSARTTPVPVRTGLVLLLTVLLQPAALAHLTAAPRITAPALAGEVVVGFAIGLGAALFVGAAEAAGELMAVQSGLSGAALFDPLNNSNSPVLGQFAQLFAVAVLLSLDAHLVILDALAASTRAVPVGGALAVAAGLDDLVRAAGFLFVLGLRFAGPVVAALMIANTALAVLTRAAPSLSLLSVAFPIQIGIGLCAVAAALPLIATTLAGWEPAYDRLLTGAFAALAGPGGTGAR
jgi:flagellar biosynthetic protein FliR